MSTVFCLITVPSLHSSKHSFARHMNNCLTCLLFREYAKRSSNDERTVSSKGGQGSSKMVDMESTNAFEFAPPMPQERHQTHHPSASEPSERLMSYLETPSSSQRLHRMLFQSSESPAGSTTTPPTGNRFYSQNTEVIKEKERWLRKSGEGY